MKADLYRQRRIRVHVALGLLLLSGQRAMAHYDVPVNLSNSAVLPPAVPTRSNGTPRPASSGTATVIVNDDNFADIAFDTVIHNIDVTGTQTPDPYDNLIGAGVHVSASLTSTTNGPRRFGYFGSQNDNTELPFDLVIQPFTTGVGGAVYAQWDSSEGNSTTLLAQYPHLLTGHAYIQYDTVQFPQGEIRGMFGASVRHGDANFDGVVNIRDLYILAHNWQSDDQLWTGGDFDGDGVVDAADLGLLSANWQAGSLGQALAATGLPPVSVPEPSCHLGVLLILSLAGFRRRRPVR